MKQKIILLSLLILSLLAVIVNDIILKNVYEIISFGSEIGQIFSNLGLAYISSYIFYILVVVLKENKDKKNVLRSVYYLTDNLVDNGYAPVSEIMEALGIGLKDYDKSKITREDFFSYCEKCDIKHIPKNKFFGTFSNQKSAFLTEFIYNSTVYHANKNIEKIFEFMPFLDSDFIALLNEVRQSIFFTRDSYSLSQISSYTNIPNKMIGRWNSMFDYIELIRKIEIYNNKYHLKYK